MLILKLVLDTNVIVSAHLNADGLERAVLTLALTAPAQFFVSLEILGEYGEVLSRKKFRLGPDEVKQSLELIRARAIIVSPTFMPSVRPDPEDNKFLACAQEVGADYLVTGNKRHFPKQWGKTKGVNARELLEIITPKLTDEGTGEANRKS
jgi:putative PIN family toxin of toxin-antitoxin system